METFYSLFMPSEEKGSLEGIPSTWRLFHCCQSFANKSNCLTKFIQMPVYILCQCVLRTDSKSEMSGSKDTCVRNSIRYCQSSSWDLHFCILTRKASKCWSHTVHRLYYITLDLGEKGFFKIINQLWLFLKFYF